MDRWPQKPYSLMKRLQKELELPPPMCVRQVRPHRSLTGWQWHLIAARNAETGCRAVIGPEPSRTLDASEIVTRSRGMSTGKTNYLYAVSREWSDRRSKTLFGTSAMTTSPTTFETDIRECLLDVLYGQWHALGVPFSTSPRPDSVEVIDPEALLWCSLEFLPTEPRLLEGTVEWLRTQGHYLVAQRIARLAKPEEPRSSIWLALPVRRSLFSFTRGYDKPEEASYGLSSPDEVIEFSAHLKATLAQNRDREVRTGTPLTGTSTLLLRARDLLGSDVRHILLVYLLANPGGLKLREIERFSGYSYRTLSEAATRWEAANLVSLDVGYCRLLDPEPWHALLRSRVRRAVIVDWLGVFDAFVRLLRAMAKTRRKGIEATSAVVDSFRAKAEEALRFGVLGETRGKLPFLLDLRRATGHRLTD